MLAAYCAPSGELLPLERCARAVCVGARPCVRVTCRGGYTWDQPEDAPCPATGTLLELPFSVPLPAGPVHYSYVARDNHGVEHQYQGDLQPSPEQAELLGWLLESKATTNTGQSVRFASSDAWCLAHVDALAERAFPAISVRYFPKSVGFDITLTGGINSPLLHFLRCMDFYSGFPLAVWHFGRESALAFLRGYWGANGWLHSRKGGNDVDLGLCRRNDEAFTFQMRHLHAALGLRGQMRATPTKEHPTSHRLVFSGYRNYQLFSDLIGQLRDKRLPHAPIRKASQRDAPFTRDGQLFYKTPVLHVRRLKESRIVWTLT